jgi:E3 ubiquitin-protein ligase synoviolin
MLLQVRDLYWTFRNFRNRVADFLRYRRVTANMDERCAHLAGSSRLGPVAKGVTSLWQEHMFGQSTLADTHSTICRFPDATEEELQRADNTCIVCREDMAPGGRNKKLRCNHVFHLHCLRYARHPRVGVMLHSQHFLSIITNYDPLGMIDHLFSADRN